MHVLVTNVRHQLYQPVKYQIVGVTNFFYIESTYDPNTLNWSKTLLFPSDLKQHKTSVIICYNGNYIKMTISRYPLVILGLKMQNMKLHLLSE